MSDPLSRIDAIAARARAEESPRADVAGHVLARIRRHEDSITRPLAIIALASSVAAAVVAGFTIQLVQTITDPLRGLFEGLPGVMP